MSKQHIKSKAVNLLMGGSVIAASDSCELAVNMNTTAANAKDDPGAGEWDNPETTYYDWSCNNESFAVDAAQLQSLLTAWFAGVGVTVKFQIDGGSYDYVRTGTAIITNLSLTSQMDDYVKVTLSFDGASALTTSTKSTISPASANRTKMRGKALMVAVNTGTEENPSWHTIACATNHTLELSHQLGDSRCKDINDMAPSKEITGHSCKITTENLIAINGSSDTCIDIGDLDVYCRGGNTVALQIGYYDGAVGHEDDDWGNASSPIIGGAFICTSININGSGTQEDATFNAEFSNKGAIELPF